MTEFVTWFIWLGLFALLQRRFCRCYPGLRYLCRNIFLVTMVVAILPALWILVSTPRGAPNLLHLLNHYFGIGVYAQTSLRALIQLRWLGVTALTFGVVLPLREPTAAGERHLLAVIAGLSQILKGGKDREPGAKGQKL